MTYPANDKFIMKYTYDFARDGGAVSTISLTADINALEENIVVEEIQLQVKTGLASAGTPTVTLGNTGDPDGYFADIWALAQTDNAVINSGSVAGALIYDDTNDHRIHYRIDSTANNQDLVMDIGTAALTAGKIEVLMTCSAVVQAVS